jgi:hypothetical protein
MEEKKELKGDQTQGPDPQVAASDQYIMMI